MKKRLDKPNYKIHKMCHDCVIEFEHKLKIRGKYNKYKETLKINNKITSLNEIESYLLDAINVSNSGYVSEHGNIERWVGGVNKKEMSEKITQAAKKTRNELKKQLKNEEK